MPEHLESKFLTTPWTLILQSHDRNSADLDGPTQTLVKLCQNYRYPVYAFIRKRCGDPERARDSTQQFFATLVEKKFYRRADPDRGRFRTFLLTAVKNYLAKDYEAANRQKRGGGKVHVPIDLFEAEQHYSLAADSTSAPEILFDREWAIAVFDRVWSTLREEYERAGETERFDALRANLMDAEDAIPYVEIAARLGLEVNGVKSAASRLRKRFRELFRGVVAQLVESPNAVDDEISYIIEIFSETQA